MDVAPLVVDRLRGASSTDFEDHGGYRFVPEPGKCTRCREQGVRHWKLFYSDSLICGSFFLDTTTKTNIKALFQNAQSPELIGKIHSNYLKSLKKGGSFACQTLSPHTVEKKN
jgi:hypothetical protein